VQVTGDTARRTPEGLYEITGRLGRFTKILGLRNDPQQIEAMLARDGVTALCTGDDEALFVAAVGTDTSKAPGYARSSPTSAACRPARSTYTSWRTFPACPPASPTTEPYAH
jgi:hypothetical protein